MFFELSLPELNIAQMFGFLSYLLGVSCFYQKDDKKLKVVMVIMSLNNALHYALLGAVTACLSSLLSLLRTGISIYTSSKLTAYLFILLTLAVGIYLSSHWFDMFPIIGACIGTYALFCLEGIKMRIAFIAGALCWLCNNIIVGSIGGTLLEITLLAVNINTIRRIYNQRHQQSNCDSNKESNPQRGRRTLTAGK